jgi:sulfur carrier protein ThiS
VSAVADGVKSGAHVLAAVRVHVARVPRPNVEEALEVRDGATVQEVLRAMRVPPDAVVVLREDRPLPVDAPVRDGERLRVLTVFSGG